MTQLTTPEKTLSLPAVLIPQIETDLRTVADIFDHSFWPPEPLDRDIAELLTHLIMEGRALGIDTEGLMTISQRFGLELDSN